VKRNESAMTDGMNRRRLLCCLACAGAAGWVGSAAAQGQGNGEGEGETVTAEAGEPKRDDIGYCGADCAACDVRKATVEGDEEARARAVRKWEKTARQHWGMKTLDPAILDCAGCRVTQRKHHGHGRCPMLPCARKRGLASCGACAEWKDCRFLKEVFDDEPMARARLQAIAEAAKSE